MKLFSTLCLVLVASTSRLLVTCETDQSMDGMNTEEPQGSSGNFQFEGKILPPDNKPKDFHWTTRILIDGGKRVAFIKEDNSFTVQGLPSGSYLVEVTNSDYYYEPVRIDINAKGKIRARKVNNVQPSQVTQLPYPLRLKPLGRQGYFQKREEWKITDMLMNPMILMMVLPLLIITVLPKMMNDPETKREMEQMQQNMSVQNQLPDVSEFFASVFGGAGSTSANDKNKKRPKPPVLRSK